MLMPLVIGFAAAWLIGQLARYWVLRRYQAGTMTGRQAGWIAAGVVAVPYALITAFALVMDQERWWVFVVLFLLVVPVVALPWIAIFRNPNEQGGKPPSG
jgi:hypothetical protein